MYQYIDAALDYENWGAVNENSWQTHRDIKLMQFTGLTDKNGKEIYEGDIVQRGVDHDNPSDIKWTPWAVGEQYDDGIGSFHHDTTELERFIGRGDVYEVIGNIYENPDLLTSKEIKE